MQLRRSDEATARKARTEPRPDPTAERGAVRQRSSNQVVKKQGSRQYGGGIAHGTNCRVELR